MKVIDLLNKIANGEEVPSKVKYFGLIYEFCDKCKQYEFNDGETRIKLLEEISLLDDELEIIEDISKEELQQRIDNAIKYIENNSWYIGGDLYATQMFELTELLNIIKGEK